MRSEADIVRAHDILTAVIQSDIKEIRIQKHDMELLHAAADVLCWVLQHEHNDTFAVNLSETRKTVSSGGLQTGAGMLTVEELVAAFISGPSSPERALRFAQHIPSTAYLKQFLEALPMPKRTVERLQGPMRQAVERRLQQQEGARV